MRATVRPWSRAARAARALRAAALVLAGAGLVVAVWGLGIEPRRLVVHRARLRLPGLGSENRGLRVALIADLHVGSPGKGLATLPDLVARTNAEHPDLVFLLGDYVITAVIGGRFVAPEPIAAALAGLRAPLGVWAVLGNHDVWHDGPRVARALSAAGIRVLQDEAVLVEKGGRRLWIAGTTDFWTSPHDIHRTLRGVTGDAPVLLLMHNPDLFPDVPARVTLTVAGHTHGGQVRLPILGAPIVPASRRYTAGEVIEDGRHLFVTTGVGTSDIPVRLGVPPEIALLELTPSTP